MNSNRQVGIRNLHPQLLCCILTPKSHPGSARRKRYAETLAHMRERILGKLGNRSDNAFKLRKLFAMYDTQRTGVVRNLPCKPDPSNVVMQNNAHGHYQAALCRMSGALAIDLSSVSGLSHHGEYEQS